MKRIAHILLALVLAVSVTGCSASSVPESLDHLEMDQQHILDGTVAGSDGVWTYELTTYLVTGEHRADDGRLLIRHSYQIPRINVDDTPVSKKNPLTEAQRSSAALNAHFESVLSTGVEWFEEVAQMAAEDYAAVGDKEGNAWQDEAYCYTDESTVSFWRNERMMCVTTNHNSFTGGIHVSVWRSCENFDLRTGKVISVTDMAENAERMRKTVRQELLRQALERMERDDVYYFSDYTDTLGEWMERSVAFDDTGMTVIFPVYDIASYAAGEQTFTIPYDHLFASLNDYGLELLGLQGRS